jgi:hypothetical protein
MTIHTQAAQAAEQLRGRARSHETPLHDSTGQQAEQHTLFSMRCASQLHVLITSFWLAQLPVWLSDRALGWLFLVSGPHRAQRLRQVALVMVQVSVRRPA